MKHYAGPEFWSSYHRLPAEVARLADRAFQLLKSNPYHPSLHFKKAGRFWCVRVGSHHRALAVESIDGFLWFWIGTHAEYDRILG